MVLDGSDTSGVISSRFLFNDWMTSVVVLNEEDTKLLLHCSNSVAARYPDSNTKKKNMLIHCINKEEHMNRVRKGSAYILSL
jgi:hypothetical protein